MASPESKLTQKILGTEKNPGYLRSIPDSWWFKVHGGPYGKNGVPDIVGCVHGLFFAFEVKAPETGHPESKLQRKQRLAIGEAGGRAWVVYSLEDVQSIMRGYEEQRGGYSG